MSTGWIVAIVVLVAVLLLAGAWLVRAELRRRHLRQTFGEEYDRLREDRQGRRAAEQELTEREKRHASLGVKPVSPFARDRYVRHWELIQAQFVDRPSTAVNEADRLVTTIMTERGYPEADFDERLAMLSVEHGPVLSHYRDAWAIKTRHEASQVSTELLRTAMVHYRTLVEDLLDEKGIGRPRTPDTVASREEPDRRREPERVEEKRPEFDVPAIPEGRTEAPVPPRSAPESPAPERSEPRERTESSTPQRRVDPSVFEAPAASAHPNRDREGHPA